MGRFEWETSADEANASTFGGVRFIEAHTVFGDRNAVYFTRVTLSYVVGYSDRDHLVTVLFTVPSAGRVCIEAAWISSPAEAALRGAHPR